MAIYIVKAKKTYLKSPLSTTATSVILRGLVSSKDGALAMSDFGDFGVIVIKQGDNIEMIKFNALTVNADDSVTLTVATNGRHLNPTTPYAGSGTGLAFQSGAEAIITNDPWTTSQFAVLANANTWALLQTFTVIPELPASNPTTDNQAVRKKYVDDTFVDLTSSETVAGVKTFSSFPITPSSAPTTDYQVANKKYVDDNAVFLTGAQTVAGVKTFSSFPVTPSSAPTTDYQVANKKYVDDTAFAGAPDASTTVKGIAEEATLAELQASTATGGTGARLYVPAELGSYIVNPVNGLLFGTGADGNVTLDGTNTYSFLTKVGSVYTMNRDVHFNNLTIEAGSTLVTDGFQFYVSGTFDGAGTLKWGTPSVGTNGGNSSGASGGGGGAGGSAGGTGRFKNVAGGNGGNGDGGGGGADAQAGTASANASNALGATGGTGGHGGDSGTAGAGGASSGTVSQNVLPTVSNPIALALGLDQHPTVFATSAHWKSANGGGGGGGGGAGGPF